MADDKRRDTIQQYVGDMVSLEGHIEQALDSQMGSFQDDPQFGQYIRLFHGAVKQHRDQLRDHLKTLGGSETHPVKEGVSTLFGLAAGAIDKLRSERLAKALRDDYTVFNLAAIGYTMLHTTALALGYQETAQIAERYLRDYASFVQQINQFIPDVVLDDFGPDVPVQNRSAPELTRQMANEVWRSTSPGHAAA